MLLNTNSLSVFSILGWLSDLESVPSLCFHDSMRAAQCLPSFLPGSLMAVST
jgi:hypothetical protein